MIIEIYTDKHRTQAEALFKSKMGDMLDDQFFNTIIQELLPYIFVCLEDDQVIGLFWLCNESHEGIDGVYLSGCSLPKNSDNVITVIAFAKNLLSVPLLIYSEKRYVKIVMLKLGFNRLSDNIFSP